MEQSTPVSAVSSELPAGQLPSNEGLRNIQQVITYMYLLPPEGMNRASCIGLLFSSTICQINVNSVIYLLMYDMCELGYIQQCFVRLVSWFLSIRQIAETLFHCVSSPWFHKKSIIMILLGKHFKAV